MFENNVILFFSSKLFEQDLILSAVLMKKILGTYKLDMGRLYWFQKNWS